MIETSCELDDLIDRICKANSTQYTTLTMNQTTADGVAEIKTKYKIIIDESCVSGEVRLS